MDGENPYQPPETDARDPGIGGKVARGHFAIAAAASFLVGVTVWASSRSITGSDEPWDASYPFYSLVMLVGGTATGIIAPRRFVVSYLAVWAGQVAGITVIPWLPATWLPLVLISTAVGSLLFLPGLFLGLGILALLARQRRRDTKKKGAGH